MSISSSAIPDRSSHPTTPTIDSVSTNCAATDRASADRASADRARKVIVIGGGIGGLTAGALLAKRGYAVTVYEQAIVPGGCASTFTRRGFTFDVGATQVAGLEPGGIHDRLFRELGVASPEATTCDPACAVFLPGESEPISVWQDLGRWQEERSRQFPGSERFWALLAMLFRASWAFQARDPVLPPRNVWDLGQLLQSLRPGTLVTAPFTRSTVADALGWLGLTGDLRLRKFLDLQLKLYSQVDAGETALLYAATALAVSQAPQGLFHLQGSMQVLSDRLTTALQNHGGQLYLRHSVEAIQTVQSQTAQGQITGVTVRNLKTKETWDETADHVVANTTVQNLLGLLNDSALSQLQGYQRRVENLPPSSGAFVIYLGVTDAAIPENCPPHLQFLYDYNGPIGENNSLFVSVSKPGDGRAPAHHRTITASSFVDPTPWWQVNDADYRAMKQQWTDQALDRLGQYFDLCPEHILHCEAATPRTFARYTARAQGIVGGVGQRLNTFGPFGFATRTPLRNLWLVGDSVHPGEGTAGVSYAALTIARQIAATR
jgi:C-3',4' desaturase CrtD